MAQCALGPVCSCFFFSSLLLSSSVILCFSPFLFFSIATLRCVRAMQLAPEAPPVFARPQGLGQDLRPQRSTCAGRAGLQPADRPSRGLRSGRRGAGGLRLAREAAVAEVRGSAQGRRAGGHEVDRAVRAQAGHHRAASAGGAGGAGDALRWRAVLRGSGRAWAGGRRHEDVLRCVRPGTPRPPALFQHSFFCALPCGQADSTGGSVCPLSPGGLCSRSTPWLAGLAGATPSPLLL